MGPVSDAAYERVLSWAEGQGLELYPHQDEAILELLSDSNVVLATPTGPGKSLVATAAHMAAMAEARVSFYSAPIKALVSEKFFALCEVFGAQDVGLLTGDASVNPGAPIICCTAEVLANIALREGSRADIGLVIMDEFHYYADPQRGWAWQVPLLELPQAQFLLMSATLGDVTELAADLTRRNGRETAVVDQAERPVPLHFSWSLEPLGETLTELVETGQAPVYVVHFTQAAAVAQAESLLKQGYDKIHQRGSHHERLLERLAGVRFGAGFGKTLSKLLRRGIGVHHAGMLPRYRRLVEQLAQEGLLTVICGTDTLGVGINVPIRTVLFTGLAKYDGHKQRVLRTREFLQIAGRAGRPGFDTAGYVVVQAPEHVIENEKAKAKAAAKNAALRDHQLAKRKSKAQLTKPPAGTVVWTEATFDKLVSGAPEPLRSRMRVDNAMLVNVAARQEDAFAVMRRLLMDNHEDRRTQLAHARRALRLARSLVHNGVLKRLDALDDVRPPLRAHRRAARGLRAQPAAGTVRDRGAGPSRPGGADVPTGHRVRDGGGAGPSAPDPDGPAARGPRRGDRRDEGRRPGVRRADGAARGGHLAEAARRPAGTCLRDLPTDASVAAARCAGPEVGGARHV